MKRPALLLVLGPAFAVRLFAAEGAPSAPATSTSDTAIITQGARVYQADCATCHNRGKAGAPRVTETADWTQRVAQGRDTLLKHALQGYSGPAGDEMPARGGNDDLTDAEVASAVDHILLLLQQNNSSKPTTP